MTDTELPTEPTWEPDYAELAAIVLPTLHDAMCDIQAVIAEYREQQRRAGIVEVRRETIVDAHAIIDVHVREPVLALEGFKRSILRSLDAALATQKGTPE